MTEKEPVTGLQQPPSSRQADSDDSRQWSDAQQFAAPAESAPRSQDDIPFEPDRTLDADAATWRFYTEEGRFHARGWLQRSCAWFSACRPRLVAQRSWQAKQAELDRAPDVERQQHLKDGPSLDAKQGEEGGGGEQRYRSRLGIPMLSPEARASHVWAALMTLLDLTYTAYLVPLSLAFDSMQGASWTWFNAVNVAGTALYVADIFVSFHTGFVLSYDVKRKVIMEPEKVADFYIRYDTFYIDCLATLPIIPEIVLSMVRTDTTAFKWFYTLRLLRLARVFGILKVWGGTVFTNTLSRWLLRYVTTSTLYLFNLLIALGILVNLMGCIWWLVAALEGLENSWAAAADLQYSLLDTSDVARWVASIYFATTTMTTVGYGDITPVTVAEQMVATLFMIVAVFYFGFIVNFIGELLHGSSRKARQADVLRHKLEDVESWMQERHMPAAMQSKVRQYYVKVWAPHVGMDDATYFADLPMDLRGEIVRGLAGETLRHSHMFRLLDDEMRAQLAGVARPVRLVAGHNLFQEGDDADAFYVLQEGEAEALRGTSRIHNLHGPALVGQAAVFHEYVEECSWRLHTVRAITNCTVWEFQGTQLAKMLKHSPGFLPPLCDSYLQHLEELCRHIAERGEERVPKRVRRMQSKIEALRAMTAAKLEGRHHRAASKSQNTTTNLPGQAPPASPLPAPDIAAAARDVRAAGGSPASPALSLPSSSSASSRNISDVALDEEQLP